MPAGVEAKSFSFENAAHLRRGEAHLSLTQSKGETRLFPIGFADTDGAAFADTEGEGFAEAFGYHQR